MNLLEYCKTSNLDITCLSKDDLKIIAHSYLAGMKPNQEKINMIADIRQGKLTPEQAVQATIKKFVNQ